MKPLSRRSVTTGIGAAVTAIPAVALSVGTKTGVVDRLGEDKFLAVIRRYQSELAAINASHDDLSDEEIDAWTDRADAVLAEAAGLPVLTAASALAALALVVKEEEVGTHSIFGEQLLALIHAVTDYIASTSERTLA